MQAQSDIERNLVAAQRDLSVGHDFFQSFYSLVRNQVTSHIKVVSTEIMRNFLENYGRMIGTQQTTEAAFRELDDSRCMQAVWRRWDLQVSRHGLSLSACLANPVFFFGEWNFRANNFIEQAQARTNPVQNIALDALSRIEDFTIENDITADVNREFRRVLLLAQEDLDTFAQITNSITEAEDQIIDILTRCDHMVAEAFVREAEMELTAARSCPPDPPAP